MDFEKYKQTVIDCAPDTEGLEYKQAVMWFHPERLPRGLVSLSNTKDTVIKVKNWYFNRVASLEDNTCYIVPVIAISAHAFAAKETVTDVILQSNIEKICKGAFAGCKNLKRITIPKKVRNILEGTFKDCDSLEDVYYEGSEEEWKNIRIVHEGARVVNPRTLGLYCEVEHYIIPGNETLFRANIHFNCKLSDSNPVSFEIKSGKKDITNLFEIKDL